MVPAEKDVYTRTNNVALSSPRAGPTSLGNAPRAYTILNKLLLLPPPPLTVDITT